MTFISRKTRLLVPHYVDECDPGYLYHVNRKRSDGRLKRHSSCDDFRAWALDENLNYEYLLELMTDGEERPFLGLLGRFIPVDVIMDILRGKASEGGDSFAEWGSGGGRMGTRMAGLKPKRAGTELKEKPERETAEDLLKLANAAMTKLETIRCIICTGSQNDKRNEDGSRTGWEVEESKDHTERSGTSRNAETEEYAAEYSSTLSKIAWLKQRLDSIQELRDELDAKIQASIQTECQQSSGKAVTELYNREEKSNAKRWQKKIEKLIAEKGEVLKEICTSLKYLNDLKKNVNIGSKQGFVCPCSCPKMDGKCVGNGRPSPQSRDDSMDGFLEKRGDSVASTSKTIPDSKSGREGCNESKMMCRKCAQCPTADTFSENRRSSRESSEATFMSVETLPVCESQKAYNVPRGRESIPDKKFKSETSMTEVEQTLRSYEQRLSELTSLESEVEGLKKRAVMAEYFKKRWFRSIMRKRNQKTAEEHMKREIEELCQENRELKKIVERIVAESQKKHNEMSRLRSKAVKLVEMQAEMTKLKDEISGYQLSFETQSECIERLESTVRQQRDEIDRLMNHMTRLCRMTEKLREIRKPCKRNCSRSRPCGPERQNSAPGTPRSTAGAEEEMQHAPCCSCNRQNCITDVLNRPRSECGRRMPDQCYESLSHQQTCRNPSRYN